MGDSMTKQKQIELGLALAEKVYLALLRPEFLSIRLSLQPELCALRDFISDAKGLDAQTVQEFFEATALHARTTGIYGRPMMERQG